MRDRLTSSLLKTDLQSIHYSSCQSHPSSDLAYTRSIGINVTSKIDEIMYNLISFSLLKTCWYGTFFFVIGMIFVCWPFLFINVFTAWHRHISPMNFIFHQSRSFEGVCIPLHLTSRLFPMPDSQPTATELFQYHRIPPFGSGTVFRSTSHPRRHFLSSALT